MTLKELNEKANGLNVTDSYKMKKSDLIWAIQKAEGYDECFSKIPGCEKIGCCFWNDCIGVAKTSTTEIEKELISPKTKETMVAKKVTSGRPKRKREKLAR